MRSSKEGAQNIIQAVLEDQEYFKVSIDQGYRNRNLSYDEQPILELLGHCLPGQSGI